MKQIVVDSIVKEMVHRIIKSVNLLGERGVELSFEDLLSKKNEKKIWNIMGIVH